MTDAAFLTVSEVTVGYGGTTVLDRLSLSVERGEFVALLGSSGCGKTTLLRTIAGFNKPQSGSLALAGRDITRAAPDRRGMAMVFQSYALWPHMTVAQNIGYGLKLRRAPRSQIAGRVDEIAAMLGLSGLEARKPSQLSGGQRQRVALGRALAVEPDILLLDEPLSNLDARVRLGVRHEIRALQKRLGITAIHVTHDREEAMVMADRIVILDRGRIAQEGSPEEVYNRPGSPFVAAFMGAENVIALEGTVEGDSVEIASGPYNPPARLALAGRALSSGRFQARFRTEAAEILLATRLSASSDPVAEEGDEGVLHLRGTVRQTSYPGGVWRHVVAIGAAEVSVDADLAVEPGTDVVLRVPPAALFLFEAPQDGAEPISRAAA
ncbi:ABC transporter ATP-binding protein [Jiella pelagia]|uniref:ABC transporter ATP-binding protein n=1 Tax=Jiella pelagia TaxID=2986949 RepID=A0ABY7C5U2_9HYPH|nr:ABC transporter ATP-binding protein [Jiella pelagia]WAP70952.1 ABC transporter ATP-binding protein [Jiella pelagia]